MEGVGEDEVVRQPKADEEDPRLARQKRRGARLGQVRPPSEVGLRPLSLERAEGERADVQPRFRMASIPEIGECPQHTCSAAVEILERTRRSPAIPGLRRPEKLRPTERSIRVVDDLADAGADPILVPGLVGERLEVLGPVEHRPLRDVADALCVGECTELLQALVLDLADPLAGDLEMATDLVKRPRLLAVEAVAQLEHLALALGEVVEDASQRLPLQRRLGQLVRERRGLVCKEVAEL